MRFIFIWISALLLIFSSQVLSGPKYAPHVKRLFQNHDYVKKNLAPDFWSLIPYYSGQLAPNTCSLASLSMLINAARVQQKLESSDNLVHERLLISKLQKLTHFDKNALPIKSGIRSLKELTDITKASFEAFGINIRSIRYVSVERNDATILDQLKKDLILNENSDRNLILVNFIQGVLTGDPDGNTGHVAPVAAYNAKTSEVLLFDPDREWYEPYWVPLKKLAEAMNTFDKTQNTWRGYIYIEF